LSAASLELMRGWLHQCETSHARCPPQSQHILPSRVIEVGNYSKEPRLAVFPGRLGRWAALSHCWGVAGLLKTEMASLGRHCEALPLELLPPTFKDAVLITRALGLQYLWIDSLCIVQDSPQDWLKESTQMGTIYKHAVVTIAAEGAKDSSVGIVGCSVNARKARIDTLIKTKCHSRVRNLEGPLFVAPLVSTWPIHQKGPLGARGWALQEEILSPRVLQFTAIHLFWRCIESQADDGFPDLDLEEAYQPNGVTQISNCYLEAVDPQRVEILHTGNVMLGYWYTNVVGEYILRQLTYKTDTLVAVSGIAKELRPHLLSCNSQYKAGLWLDDFHRGLLWSPTRFGDPSKAKRQDEYIAPSWSWASLEISQTADYKLGLYRDIWEVDDLSELKPIADIIDVSIFNATQDVFGQVQSGSLTIETQCCDICYCRVPKAFIDERPIPGNIEATVCDIFGATLDYANSERCDQERFESELKGGLDVWTSMVNELERLKIKLAGSQECLQDPDVTHKQLIYANIAWIIPEDPKLPDNPESQDIPNSPDSSDMGGPYRPVLAGLILEPVQTEITLKYVRVGRVILQPDGFEEEAIEWPTRTLVII
jgi:hypothetical protein